MLLKYLQLLAKENNIKDFDKFKTKAELKEVLEKNAVKIDKSDKIKFMAIEDLYELAKKRGVKYYTLKSKKELAEILGIDCKGINFNDLKHMNKNPTKIILRNEETGEILKFTSINNAAKELKLNPSSIFCSLKNKKLLKINDECFSVMIDDTGLDE